MVGVDLSVLESAIEVARTKWLRQLLAEHLTRLVSLGGSQEDLEAAKKWDCFIKEQFAERGLISPSQQKNPITDVRNAIKIIDPEHPVLQVVGFSAAEWIEINQSAIEDTTSRTTQFLANPETIVNQASVLLNSRTWSEVAASLAVVTGRRVSEILKTAEFSFKSTYSVMFTGAVKRRHESVPLTFEIPTLVPAQTVIDAIAQLRSWLDTSNMTNRQINVSYEQTVAQTCDRFFRDLVPLRSGKGNLYTHLFRAVYATIAAHWFCPPTVSDLEFRAYIQGHFQILNETSDQKRTSMAAQRHYWDYKIENGQGNVDGRLGIKLQDPEVQVLSAFERQLATSEIATHGTKVHLRVFDDDRTILAQIQSRFDLPSRAAANHFVLELAQSLLSAADTNNQTPQQLIAQLKDLKNESPNSSQTDLFGEESSFESEPNSEGLSHEVIARRTTRAGELGSPVASSSAVKRQSTDDSPQLENPEFSEGENEKELTTKNSSGVPNVDEKEAGDLTINNDQQLENQAPRTVNHQQALFERMEQQQQSMENLTRAIHGLVSVLASSTNSKKKTTFSSSVGTLNKSQSEEIEDGKPTSSLSLSDSSCSSDSSFTTPEENKSRKRRGELSRQKVNQYIDAIMAYNDVTDRPHGDKWLITIAALKRLTHCGQSVIYDVLRSRSSDIQFHHDQHQLGIFHNQKGRNAQPIESLICLIPSQIHLHLFDD